ncbi:hypothetical protein STP1_2421 [Staphylococcus pasteuri SP1]|nr:hypothetical protein STP1_2421 [Staphylococcus pasteuri SP1]
MVIAGIICWTFWLRAKSLSLFHNNGVHHLYINVEQVAFQTCSFLLNGCVSLLTEEDKY